MTPLRVLGDRQTWIKVVRFSFQVVTAGIILIVVFVYLVMTFSGWVLVSHRQMEIVHYLHGDMVSL
jgi:hypothetical protein